MVVAGRRGIVTRWPLEVNRGPPIRPAHGAVANTQVALRTRL